MHPQRVVLGVGNPGDEYRDTRHNVGFLVLDRAAERLGTTFHRLDRRALGLSGKVKALVAEGAVGSATCLLVKPLTYVNLSGDVAGALLRVAGLEPASLFVVVDDLNLPLGRIRIRPSGSSGGHNGLHSIEQALGSSAYPRLRLGIGQAESTTPVEHVLGPFLREERAVIDPALLRAADAVALWVGGTSLQTLMDRFNGPGSGGFEENV
jgi:PTH1 family peptidyl-tRNA hydrolase